MKIKKILLIILSIMLLVWCFWIWGLPEIQHQIINHKIMSSIKEKELIKEKEFIITGKYWPIEKRRESIRNLARDMEPFKGEWLKGNYEEAEKIVLKVSKDKDYIWFNPYLYLAECYKQYGLTDKAIYWYEKGIKEKSFDEEFVVGFARPPLETIYYRLGGLYAEEKKWEKALNMYNAALFQNPLDYRYMEGSGLMLYSLGKLNQAEKRLKEACELFTMSYLRIFELGPTYELNGKNVSLEKMKPDLRAEMNRLYQEFEETHKKVIELSKNTVK